MERSTIEKIGLVIFGLVGIPLLLVTFATLSLGTLASVIMGVVRLLAWMFHFSLPIPYWPIPVVTIIAWVVYELLGLIRQALLTKGYHSGYIPTYDDRLW